MNLVENTLAYHDETLLRHFVRMEVTAQLYAWPLIHTLLSEVLVEVDWMILWDNVLSNHPGFLVFAAVSFLIECRVR